jgi:cytochrome c5
LIRTPKQLVVVLVASFVLPVIIIIMLINFVAWDSKPGAGSDGLTAEAVARRIQPVGVSDYKDVTDVKSMKTGEQVFQAQCTACHTSGAVGAPKIGDEAAWGPRVKAGYDTLLNSALKGKGNMPPQGGGDSSEFEIGRAVVFMANKGGAKFDEPKAPAEAASAAK